MENWNFELIIAILAFLLSGISLFINNENIKKDKKSIVLLDAKYEIKTIKSEIDEIFKKIINIDKMNYEKAQIFILENKPKIETLILQTMNLSRQIIKIINFSIFDILFFIKETDKFSNKINNLEKNYQEVIITMGDMSVFIKINLDNFGIDVSKAISNINDKL